MKATKKILMFVPIVGIFFRYSTDKNDIWFRLSGFIQSLSMPLIGLIIGLYF